MAMLSFKDFADRSGDIIKNIEKYSLDIDRKNMPQVSEKDMPDFISYLEDSGITVKKQGIEVSKLKATQKHINPEKVIGLMTNAPDKLNKPLVASNDNYILDGHHRWAALWVRNDKFKVPVYKADVPIEKLLKVAKGYSGVGYKTLKERLEVELAELFDQAAKVSLIKAGTAYMATVPLEDDTLFIRFGLVEKGYYDLSFYTQSSKASGQNMYNATGRKQEFKIFSAVVQAVRQFLAKVKPIGIAFTAAAHEPTRAKLYASFVARAKQMFGSYEGVEDVDDISFGIIKSGSDVELFTGAVGGIHFSKTTK